MNNYSVKKFIIKSKDHQFQIHTNTNAIFHFEKDSR
jgi:hypothetical protein